MMDGSFLQFGIVVRSRAPISGSGFEIFLLKISHTMLRWFNVWGLFVGKFRAANRHFSERRFPQSFVQIFGFGCTWAVAIRRVERRHPLAQTPDLSPSLQQYLRVQGLGFRAREYTLGASPSLQ